MKFDVVIAGAGPAGSGASLFLSKAGIPHLLIDKSDFPRDKVCGDALSGKVVEVLNKYDTSLVAEMARMPQQFLDSWGVVFGAPNGKELAIPFRSANNAGIVAPGFISKRVDFDLYLFQKTISPFAERWTHTTLLKAEQQKDGLVLHLNKNGSETTVTCKLLIDACGDRSPISRGMGGQQMEDAHYCAGIRAYYKGVAGMHPQNFIELHFLEELLPGYFWIFPLPNGMANVGAGMLSKSVSDKKVNLREAMLKAIRQNPRISQRFANAEPVGKIQGWGLPLGSKKRPLSGHHFLLTGDAGSLIDPFTGEGIGNALYSGMLAAETAMEALQQKCFDAGFLHRYDERIYNRLWNELQVSHTLQKLCKYPWLFNFVVNKALHSKTLRETISCMFEDADLRGRFRNPLFYLRILFE